MQTSTPKNPSEAQWPLDTAQQRVKALYAQGRYQEVLALCLQAVRTHPESAYMWHSAAASCIYL
jgi:hypothetical protein